MKTLADKAQAFVAKPTIAGGRTAKIGEPLFAKLRMRLRESRRFTLSPEFLEAAVIASTSEPPVTLRRAYLACKLPFPTTWIEWDQQHRVEVGQRLGVLAEEPDDSDRGLEGFLLLQDSTDADKWTGTGFYAGRHEADDATMLLCGQSLTPIQTSRPFETDEDWWRESVLSGWGYRPNPELLEEPGYREEFVALLNQLVERGGTSPEARVILPLMNYASAHGLDGGSNAMGRGFLEHAKETRGDLRFLVTVLAMLNSVPTRYVHQSSPGRFTRRLNSMAYLDTHVVHLEVRKTHVVRIMDKAARAEAKRMRRHEVRGFWRVAERGKGRQGCQHLPTDGDGLHCQCGRCGSRLVWVPSFMRGDASLGFVRKSYEVH